VNTHKEDYSMLDKEKKKIEADLEGVNHHLKQKKTLEDDLENLKESLEREKKER
jgi:hypothetical protein